MTTKQISFSLSSFAALQKKGAPCNRDIAGKIMILDLLTSILGFLTRKEMCQIARVNRFFEQAVAQAWKLSSQIVRSSEFQNRLERITICFSELDEREVALLSRIPPCACLELSILKREDPDLEPEAPKLTNLTRLKIGRIRCSYEWLYLLLKRCPNLAVLDLGRRPPAKRLMAQDEYLTINSLCRQLPKLKQLDLSGWDIQHPKLLNPPPGCQVKLK